MWYKVEDRRASRGAPTYHDVELRFVYGKVVVLAPDLFRFLDVGHGCDSDETVRRQFSHVLGRLHESVQVFFYKRYEKKQVSCRSLQTGVNDQGRICDGACG